MPSIALASPVREMLSNGASVEVVATATAPLSKAKMRVSSEASRVSWPSTRIASACTPERVKVASL